MIGFVTRVENEFGTMNEADCYWYKWEVMPGQGFARSGCVTVAEAQKSPEVDNCPGQAGAADNCPVTAVKGLAAEKSPVQSHVSPPAQILGIVTRAELDCVTVSATVTATANAFETVTVALIVTATVKISKCCGQLWPCWL